MAVSFYWVQIFEEALNVQRRRLLLAAAGLRPTPATAAHLVDPL